MERLDKHFEKLTKASFARYGFAYGELMARWPEIVGETLSQQYLQKQAIEKWDGKMPTYMGGGAVFNIPLQ